MIVSNAPETAVRLIDVSDAAVLAEHRVRDREEFSRWEPARPEDFFTTAGQARRIQEILETHGDGAAWPGVILADDVVIGQITISTIVRGPLQKGFLGYWVGSPYHGHGHATRAVGMALRVMRDELGLSRAEAHTQLENIPSQRVLRNNGFTPWGIAHSHIFIDGAWRDEIFWEHRLSDRPL